MTINMDIRTPREKARDAMDARIRRDFLAEINISMASTCRIARAMAASGEYGYKSMTGILASLRRTGTIDALI